MRATHPVRRVASVAAGIAAVAGLTLGFTAAPAAADTGESYVALGDSMASGPLIPDITGQLACGRSTHNYAHDLAASIGATLHDVTCSGADTGDMTHSQSLSIAGVDAGTADPQFDALTADTDLVTLTIGGNDVGLVGIADKCVNLDPTATPCKNDYVSGGVDTVAQKTDAFAPKLAAVLDGIHQRSPHAHVVVTGYGLYIKHNGCWPIQPVLPTDANFLQGEVNYLDQTISRVAAAHQAQYVDLLTPSKGHDACQSASKRWLEGYVPVHAAAPLHPNKSGEAAYAGIIGDALAAN